MTDSLDRFTMVICAERGGPGGAGCTCQQQRGHPNEFVRPCARLRAMVREGLEMEGRVA